MVAAFFCLGIRVLHLSGIIRLLKSVNGWSDMVWFFTDIA